MTNFDINYLRTSEIEWAEIFLGHLCQKVIFQNFLFSWQGAGMAWAERWKANFLSKYFLLARFCLKTAFMEFLPGNNYPDSHHLQGVWNLPHKFHLYLIVKCFSFFHVRSFTRSSRRSENFTRRRDIRTRRSIITLLISKSEPETLPVSRRNPGTFFASRSGQLLQHAVSERARIDGRCRECRWNDVAVDDVTCDVVCR